MEITDYTDPRMKSAMDDITDHYSVSQNTKGVRLFKSKYANRTVDSVSWLEACKDAYAFGCPKYTFVFILVMLEHGYYQNDYSAELYHLLPSFRMIAAAGGYNIELVVCGEDISRLIIYTHTSRDSKFGYALCNGNNPFVKNLLVEFMSAERHYNRWHNRAVLEEFIPSLGRYEPVIKDYTGFNGSVFWEQIDYYKHHFKDDTNNLRFALHGVVHFYRWLVNKYDTYDFFGHDFNMTKQLLFNSGLLEIVQNDYYVTTYDPMNDVGDRAKVCFILRGMNDLSTRITKEDFFSVDISRISSSFYRKAVLKYILNSTNITIVTWSGQTNYLCDGLAFLLRMKEQKGYPNSSERYLTNQEAVLIKNYFVDEKLQISTLNNKIGSMRRFFQWCKDNAILDFDDMFFEYLKQYEEPAKTKGSAVSDKSLALLNQYIVEDSKTNSDARLAYAIFHLAIQTEFRINQICHLQIDCVQPSLKPNQYYVYTNSKTSHGGKNKYVITGMTYHILMNIIEDTESVRAECNIESLKDYIFLKKTASNVTMLFGPAQFRHYMKTACKALGFSETYTAANLRDTHMTKAFEHILRNGKSDLEMGVLSKHKHLDTTKNHYIEMELSKMLEATYGITIGTELIDADEKIVDTIPESASGTDSDVENGCGKCIAEKCLSTSSLPCMACKYFITTVAHEKHFIKSIENVDRLITHTTNAHDKEDLVTVKQLYVLYLKAIYKKKEEYKA